MDPLTWLEVLTEALDKRRDEVVANRDWYEGRHPIPAPPANTAAATDREARMAFEVMAQLAITNFMPPIVDHPASRLRVEGFRFSESPTSTDADLWQMWRRNHLPADSKVWISDTLAAGEGFLMVWPGPDGRVEITIEDAANTIVAYEAGSRHRRIAALKRWVDDDGHTRANVYLRDGIYKYRSQRPADTKLVLPRAPGFKESWEQYQPDVWPVRNPWGVVPIVESRVNAPIQGRRFGGGRPQFHRQITDQKRINRTVMGRLVTEDYQSFRQRWVTGWDFPTLEDGSPDKTAIQRAGAARMFTFDDPNVKVGEFSQADFTGFLRAVQEDVKVIAATSSTPPYAFLIGDMINVASDALARIEGTALALVADLADQISAPLVEALRLALLMEGDQRAADDGLTVVWGEFEHRTAAEQTQLAEAADRLGAPKEVVYAMLPGVDQTEAARWRRQRAGAQLLESAIADVANATEAQ